MYIPETHQVFGSMGLKVTALSWLSEMQANIKLIKQFNYSYWEIGQELSLQSVLQNWWKKWTNRDNLWRWKYSVSKL